MTLYILKKKTILYIPKSKPKNPEDNVNGLMGNAKLGVNCPRIIPGCTKPTKSVYSPVNIFHNITNVAINVTANTSRPTFCCVFKFIVLWLLLLFIVIWCVLWIFVVSFLKAFDGMRDR